jgi:hypothetical protein
MRAASRGSSSFHGIAKQGSYPVRVRRLDPLGLEGVLDLDLALSEVSDIPLKIRWTVGAQPLQRSGEPTLKTGADGGELPFDGDLGEVIDGDSERLRGPFEVPERLITMKMDGEGSAAHGL